MAAIDDYRALHPQVRHCWLNFYRTHIISGPTPAQAPFALEIHYQQLPTVCRQNWSAASWFGTSTPDNSPPWTPATMGLPPDPTVWVGSSITVERANPQAYQQAYPALVPLARRKVRRCYNTGISRRRRNL